MYLVSVYMVGSVFRFAKIASNIRIVSNKDSTDTTPDDTDTADEA